MAKRLSILFESYCNTGSATQRNCSRTLSILFESYCNRLPVRGNLNLEVILSILFESYCNPEVFASCLFLPKAFNSLRVLLQLKYRFAKTSIVAGLTFNSLRVLLQHWAKRLKGLSDYTFNSLRVLLQHTAQVYVHQRLQPFNSLRVLLQPAYSAWLYFYYYCFQFSSSLIATLRVYQTKRIAKNTFNSLRVLLQPVA